jgi:tau tubulin kinase
MLDFGLCRAYATHEKPFRRKRVSAPFRGTSRYAPRTAFKKDEMARKDDLETWLYMIIEQMTGKLPWGHVHKNDKAKLLQMKENAFNSDANIAALTKDCPKEYTVLAKYINTLEYTDIPDYSYMYAMLDRAMNKIGVTDDEPYDWELETEFFGPSEPYSHLEDSDE